MKFFNHNLIYTLEAVCVLVPAVIFLIVTFPFLLIATSVKISSITLVILWIGGWLGVIGMIQLLIRLKTKNTSKIQWPWIKLSAGTIAAVSPIVLVYNFFGEDKNSLGFLLFLCPIVVSAHWVYALKLKQVELNKAA